MRIPYGRSRAVTIGGRMHPEAVKVELPLSIRPRVRRLLSWPGAAVILVRYESKER